MNQRVLSRAELEGLAAVAVCAGAAIAARTAALGLPSHLLHQAALEALRELNGELPDGAPLPIPFDVLDCGVPDDGEARALVGQMRRVLTRLGRE
jgi:hypothetical protein